MLNRQDSRTAISLVEFIIKRLFDGEEKTYENWDEKNLSSEVQEWLSATFTCASSFTKSDEINKRNFRTIVQVIGVGIFVKQMLEKKRTNSLFPIRVIKALQFSDDWSFDMFKFYEATDHKPLKFVVHEFFRRYDIIKKYEIPLEVLDSFLSKIEEGYCKYGNPYHNNIHAADVVQTLHFMLYRTGFAKALTDLEIFAIFIAAIIHDYEHTGTTNNFHVATASDLAILYNDKSVLENHHVSSAFSVMLTDESNILKTLSREDFKTFRSLVIGMVLYTDMSLHFQQLHDIKNSLEEEEPNITTAKALSFVLHCCDIAHPAKEWNLHYEWTKRVMEEFFRQGDMEKALGLECSPLCDRTKTAIPDSQIGFIDYIVEPSLTTYSDMITMMLRSHPAAEGVTSEANDKRIKKDDVDDQFERPWEYFLQENKRLWQLQAAKTDKF